MNQVNKTLTLGSLFDGSGGFPLGGLLSGIIPIWASEVEPFPIRVTTKRLPCMKHYGDVSAMNGGEIEPVDIITFGSPCQDMSIAGKRSGLDGSRSSLFYEAIRIIKEMRCATNGRYPRWICWENVPGAFSSNAGADFKAVLEAVIGIVEPGTEVPDPPKNRWPISDVYMGDNWSVAYRVLDAQWWGVPQRRKRVYLVGSLADRSAGQILFESEGLSGYSAESFRAWQRASRSPSPCIGATGRQTASAFDGYNGDLTGDVSSTLGVNCGMSTGRNGIVLNDQGGNRMDITDEVSCTLRAEAHHPPCVMESAGFCTEHSANARGIGYEEETSPTLRAGVVPAAIALENHPTDSRVKISEDGTVQTLTSRMGTGGMNVPLLLKIRSGCEGGGKGPLIQEDKSATLGCNNDQTLFEPKAWDGGEVSPALTANNADGHQRMPNKNNFNCVAEAFGISSKDSNAMKSANPHSGIYEAETARTLDANGGNPSCNQGGIAVVEGIPFTQNQRNEVRLLGEKSGAICQAFTKQQTYVLQERMVGRKNENDLSWDRINENVNITPNTSDRHCVYAMTTGSFSCMGENVAPALLARDWKDPTAVAYGIGRDNFNQGENSLFSSSISEELQPTLVAKGPGAVAAPDGKHTVSGKNIVGAITSSMGTKQWLGNQEAFSGDFHILEPQYTVRRLTPTECARLQGFPDWWCSDLGTENPTAEDIAFWAEVFETHRKITGGRKKPKTEKQILKWLKEPYSDAAEYKMWGNGVALPCVYFVLSGIVWCTQIGPDNSQV